MYQGLTYQEIVNIFLGEGSMRRGQVLGVDGEKSAVQVDDSYVYDWCRVTGICGY